MDKGGRKTHVPARLLPCVPEIVTLISKNIKQIIVVASLGSTKWLITQKKLGHKQEIKARACIIGPGVWVCDTLYEGSNPLHTVCTPLPCTACKAGYLRSKSLNKTEKKKKFWSVSLNLLPEKVNGFSKGNKRNFYFEKNLEFGYY
jgi:hypothetical protein